MTIRERSMSLIEAKYYAEHNSYNSGKFIAQFPDGEISCTWLDAYFGAFQAEGQKDMMFVDTTYDLFPELRVRVLVEDSADDDE